MSSEYTFKSLVKLWLPGLLSRLGALPAACVQHVTVSVWDLPNCCLGFAFQSSYKPRSIPTRHFSVIFLCQFSFSLLLSCFHVSLCLFSNSANFGQLLERELDNLEPDVNFTKALGLMAVSTPAMMAENLEKKCSKIHATVLKPLCFDIVYFCLWDPQWSYQTYTVVESKAFQPLWQFWVCFTWILQAVGLLPQPS